MELHRRRSVEVAEAGEETDITAHCEGIVCGGRVAVQLDLGRGEEVD